MKLTHATTYRPLIDQCQGSDARLKKPNLAAFWLIQIPLAWILATPVGMAERGVFIAVPVAYSVLAVTSTVLFRKGKWRSTQLDEVPTVAGCRKRFRNP